MHTSHRITLGDHPRPVCQYAHFQSLMLKLLLGRWSSGFLLRLGGNKGVVVVVVVLLFCLRLGLWPLALGVLLLRQGDILLGHLRELRTSEGVLDTSVVDDGFVVADGMQVLGAIGLSEYGRVRAAKDDRSGDVREGETLADDQGVCCELLLGSLERTDEVLTKGLLVTFAVGNTPL